MLGTHSEIAGFAFAACPLDRCDALRDRPDELARRWPSARLLVLDEAGDALCGEDGLPLPLTGADLGGGGPGTAIFLGVEAGGTGGMRAGLRPRSCCRSRRWSWRSGCG